MQNKPLSLFVCASILALAGCSGADQGSGGGGAGGGTSTATGGGGTGGSTSSATGPVVRIHMRANTDPVTHDDGLAGETPIFHSSGMRKFQLFQDANDPAPYTVFDHGSGFVEAGYNDGDDTVVATVPIADLPTAHYTVARVVHSHVHYVVAATMHANGLDLPGKFDNIQVMSDGTVLDGKTYDAGHYDYTFEVGGKSYSLSGEGAPEPAVPSSGGFSVKQENGEWAYYFPVDLAVSPDAVEDVDVVFEVNMFESFRWQDQDGTGYTTGVFDTTPSASEPVMRFGANSFTVTYE